MKSHTKEYLVGENLRCGRCAGVLPDETLTYCPHCGNLFSTIPPTTAYCDIQSRRFEKEKRRQYFKFSLGFAAVFVLGSLLYTMIFRFYGAQVLEHIQLDRRVVVYIQNQKEFPSYPQFVLRQAVSLGVQAYSDHFDFEISDWSVKENSRPDFLNEVFASTESQLLQSLGFWKELFDKNLSKQWRLEPYSELQVYMSNFPIKVGAEDAQKIETQHLSRSGLVTGLGHPGLVILSTYRAKTEMNLNNESEASHFLGEYAFAHEMGHALLGFLDYVVPSSIQDFRGPASVSKVSLAPRGTPYSECLMHTDMGGGLRAWSQLRHRTVGSKSHCMFYKDILDAHRIRRESLSMAKEGKVSEAIVKLKQSLETLNSEKTLGRVNSWLLYQWKHELSLLESL